MKKFNLYFFNLLLLVFISFPAFSAENCNLTTRFCTDVDQLTAKIKKCTNNDQLISTDFGKAISPEEFSDVPDECLDAPLTDYDRSELKKSFSQFFDAYSDQSARFSRGKFSKESARKQFNVIKERLYRIIDDSVSYRDLFYKMVKL